MKAKYILTIPFILAAAIILSLMFSIGARAHELNRAADHERYMITLEDDYVSRLRVVLGEHGIKNCGVNFTKIVDTEGNRNYNCVIYDASFSYRSEEQLEDLRQELLQLQLASEDECLGTISYEISLDIPDTLMTDKDR